MHPQTSSPLSSQCQPTSFSYEKIYRLHELNKLRSKHQQKAFKIIQSILMLKKIHLSIIETPLMGHRLRLSDYLQYFYYRITFITFLMLIRRMTDFSS